MGEVGDEKRYPQLRKYTEIKRAQRSTQGRRTTFLKLLPPYKRRFALAVMLDRLPAAPPAAESDLEHFVYRPTGEYVARCGLCNEVASAEHILLSCPLTKQKDVLKAGTWRQARERLTTELLTHNICLGKPGDKARHHNKPSISQTLNVLFNRWKRWCKIHFNGKERGCWEGQLVHKAVNPDVLGQMIKEAKDV